MSLSLIRFKENRFELLKNVILTIKKVCANPLSIRMSTDEISR